MSKFIPWVLEYPEGVKAWEWLLVTGLGFALVLLVLFKFVFPMVLKPLRERYAAIVEADQQVEATLKETEELRRDYQQRLERIEDETETRMTEAIREAEELKEKILAEARSTAEQIVSRGAEEVERDRAKAMQTLRIQFVNDVIDAAEYAAEKSLDGTRQQTLIQQFVSGVAAPGGAR